MRLRHFFMFQRAAFRALFRRRTRLVDLPMAYEGPAHPSTSCRCYDPHVSSDPTWLAHADHRPDCPWAAVMCKACDGTGWCQSCGGDGCRSEAWVTP